MTSQPVRPRFGSLIRADGSEVPLVFLSTDDPMRFEGVRADTREPVVLMSGDQIRWDQLGAGQSVIV